MSSSHTLALACISFEMDQISIRISLQKDPNFVINFVLYKKNRAFRIAQNAFRKILRHLETRNQYL
jgi:hypothetical protein